VFFHVFAYANVGYLKVNLFRLMFFLCTDCQMELFVMNIPKCMFYCSLQVSNLDMDKWRKKIYWNLQIVVLVCIYENWKWIHFIAKYFS